MSEAAPVRRFRSAFRKALGSGETGARRNDAQIDVNVAARNIAQPKHLWACLDAYRAMFNPQHPPTDRNAFEIARSTGYALLQRAIALSPMDRKLLDMVLALPTLALKDIEAERSNPWVAYAHRWATLVAGDRRRLAQAAEGQANVLKLQHPQLLLDNLIKAYPAAGPAPTMQRLLDFEPPGKAAVKKRFQQLVAACSVSWFDKSLSEPAALDRVQRFFSAFTKLVESELRQPIDLFRMLKWIRAPLEARDVRFTRRDFVVVRDLPLNQAHLELYFEVAWRGQVLAASRWNHLPTQRAHGYGNADRAFILQPLDGKQRALLDNRLQAAWKDGARLRLMIDAWRKARMIGRYHRLEILDEVETVALSKRAAEAWKTRPDKVEKYRIHHPDTIGRKDQWFWNAEQVGHSFSILWIDPGRRENTGTAYVNVASMPGFVFSTDHGGLADLQENEFFKQLADNAEALKQFMLLYLRVVGFAFEITVSAVSGGLGHIVFDFAKNRLVEAVTDEALDEAKITNPYLRNAVHLATSLIPSAKLGKVAVRSAAQVDAELMVAAARAAAKARNALESRGLGDNGLGAVAPPRLSENNVVVLPETSGRTAAARDILTPRGVSRVQRGLAHARDLADRAADFVPSIEREAALAGAGPGMPLMRERAAPASGGKAPTSSRARGGAGSRGKSPRPTPHLIKEFERSPLYKQVQRYDEERLLSKALQDKIRTQRSKLVTGLRNNLTTLADAESQLRGMLYRALEETGERVATELVLSEYQSVRLLSRIPRRGAKGPQIIDLVFTVSDRGRRFYLLVEAKGGKRTRLGRTANYRYAFQKGQLKKFEPPGSTEQIQQASGPWYYQRFAEIYMKGGAANRALALRLFEAAEKGEAKTLVIKAGGAEIEPYFLETTEDIVHYFKTTLWNRKHAFPIPSVGIP